MLLREDEHDEGGADHIEHGLQRKDRDPAAGEADKAAVGGEAFQARAALFGLAR